MRDTPNDFCFFGFPPEKSALDHEIGKCQLSNVFQIKFEICENHFS